MTDSTVIESDAPAGQAADTGPTIEDRAKEMGWRPQSEYKGSAPWVDPETFVKRGEEMLPIIRANAKKDKAELAATKASLERLEKTLADFSEFHSKTAQREYARASADLEARLTAAAEIGDTEGVKAANKAIVALEKEAKAPEPGKSDGEAEYKAWVKENPWFETDAAMRGAAKEYGQEAVAKGLSPAAQLVEVTKRIKADFPHKFENTRRNDPAAVAGHTVARTPGGKTFSDLPADAKAQAMRFEKQGLVTREQYAKDFDWDAK